MKRRSLLKLLGTGIVANSYLPAQLMAARKLHGKRVILVELSGANDGLNTLVPFVDERYHELRPTIGLKADDVIAVDDSIGLHSALRGLMPAWEAGDMAIVHGLGYPKPNRSHFKSISLWESGGDGSQAGRRGWLTHAIEHRYALDQVDAHGICFDGRMGVFSSDGGHWLSMSSATQFDQQAQVGAVVPSTSSTLNPALDLILSRQLTLQRSVSSITAKLRGSPKNARVSRSELGYQLNHVVNLVQAGVESPVLKVSLGGFDTHENQQWRHRNLLKQLGEALGGLRRELISAGEWNQTLVMTYSEFGRRARENRSNGTDHGTAAPHFVMGGGVRGGQYGHHPDLAALVDDDMQFTMDYRALYDSVLSQWLEIQDTGFTQYRDAGLHGLV